MLRRSAILCVGLSMAPYTAAGAAQVDACKLIDAVAVNSAAKAWFDAIVPLTLSSVPGARGGTCGYTTESPKHIDFTFFYAPIVVDPGMYGLAQSAPKGETPVPGAGERAVYDDSTDPGGRFKMEEIAVLKGNAVLVFSLTLDKSVAFVPKEKLAEFVAKQVVPKM
jgi:hypothetical protein